MTSTAFIVARHDLRNCKLIETRLPDADALPDEALLVKVDRFAFTANNITYATLGEQLKYWQLFPAPEGFGNIPVWGFGEVIASRHPSIAIGERLFGYFPMATHLVIEAAEVSKRGLRDAAAHLWWSYYRALKKREGVLAGTEKANAVSNNVPVAKRS